jgi:hypothetical protein
MEDVKNSWYALTGKRQEKRPLGRPRRRCKDYIKIDLGGIVWEGVD